MTLPPASVSDARMKHRTKLNIKRTVTREGI